MWNSAIKNCEGPTYFGMPKYPSYPYSTAMDLFCQRMGLPMKNGGLDQAMGHPRCRDPLSMWLSPEIEDTPAMYGNFRESGSQINGIGGAQFRSLGIPNLMDFETNRRW